MTDFSKLSRSAAKKNLDARSKMMVRRIKALPLAEQFRMVADFIDKGLDDFARKTAEHAMAELRGARKLEHHTWEDRGAGPSVCLRCRSEWLFGTKDRPAGPCYGPAKPALKLHKKPSPPEGGAR